jgi:hypothetical protein
MVKWLNHATIAAPREGALDNDHTVGPDGTGGTVVAGSSFVPTAGRFLVCLVTGAVTSTTPTGWTLPAGGSAINNVGLYLWYRTAAGGDTFTTVHNGSNYPVVFDFYEFAAGTAFIGSAGQGNISSGAAGPGLSGLTATANLRCAVVGQANFGAAPLTYTWSVGTEAVDTSVVNSGTDGYGFSMAYLEDQVSGTFSSAATSTSGSPTTERIDFALNVPASALEVAVDTSALALQGQQPTLTGSGETSTATDVGGLTLIGQQPTLSGEGAALVAVDVGGYALAGQQPILEGSGAVEIPVDTASLSLSGLDLDLSGDTALVSVDTAVLALEGQQAVLSTETLPIEIPVDPAILILSGQQTTISGVTTLVAVQPAVLDIFGVQAFLVDASVPPLPDDDVLLVLRVTNGDVILALSTGPVRDLEMR